MYLKKELMEQIIFVAVDMNLGKINVTLISFGWLWSKRGVAFLGHETLKSTISQ